MEMKSAKFMGRVVVLVAIRDIPPGARKEEGERGWMSPMK